MVRRRTDRRPSGRSRLSVAMGVLLLQLAVVVLLGAAGTVVAVLAVRAEQFRSAGSRTVALAETVAADPGIAQALRRPDPTATLQPLTLRIQHETGVDFVVVMSPQGVRYTHPNPARIGSLYLGHIAPALSGRVFSETYLGTLGLSVRSVAPIYAPAGSGTGNGSRIIGLVSVGITVQQISTDIDRALPGFLGFILGAFVLMILGSWAVAHRLRRQTLGLGPVEITRMFEHYDAVLHAMHEGLLVTDPDGRIALANDEARRLLGCADDPAGRPVSSLGLEPALAQVLCSGRTVTDASYVCGERVLVVNQSPARRAGRDLGTVTTLRDHTELRALTGELDRARSFADALSASGHEAAGRLHTVVTLIELGRPQDAVAHATTQLAASQRLIDQVMGAVPDPVVAALLLGKTSQAAERGVDLSVHDELDGFLPSVATADLVTVLGNLVDNAIEAVTATAPPRRVTVALSAPGSGLRITVGDSGPGIPTEHLEKIFERGVTTKPDGVHGLGLALVRQVVRRLDGRIDVARDACLGGAAVSVWLPAVGPVPVAEVDLRVRGDVERVGEK